MSSGSQPPPSGRAHRPRSRKEKTRLIVIGAGVALAIVFAVVNLNKVSVDWIVTTSHTSLTIVIVVSFLVGAAVGALVMRRRASSGPS